MSKSARALTVSVVFNVVVFVGLPFQLPAAWQHFLSVVAFCSLIFACVGFLVAHNDRLQRWRRGQSMASMVVIFLVCGTIGLAVFLLAKRSELTAGESTAETARGVTASPTRMVPEYPKLTAETVKAVKSKLSHLARLLPYEKLTKAA